MNLRPASFLSALPYFAAFVAAPFAILAGKLTDRADVFLPFGLGGLSPWLALSGLALAASLFSAAQKRAQQERKRWPVAALGLVLALAAWTLFLLLPPILDEALDLAPLLAELHLPALAFFALLWAASFGAPERGALASVGAALGALTVLDFLLTAIMARSLVLGGGYLFGGAPGTADLLAFLLCLALAATLDDEARPGQPRLARWLILTGLLATFSRPGLLAGGLMCLVLERGPLRQRLALALGFALAAWMTLALPLPSMPSMEESDALGLGLGWHLAATMEALAMPDFQGLLWDDESQGLPVSVFDIPSSGLRLLAAWGVGGPLVVLAAAGYCALRGGRRFGLGLFTALIVCAVLTPVLHTPATTGALALALVAAAKPRDANPA